jgi:hypothetical protein
MVSVPVRRYSPAGATTILPPCSAAALNADWNATVSSVFPSPLAPKSLMLSPLRTDAELGCGGSAEAKAEIQTCPANKTWQPIAIRQRRGCFLRAAAKKCDPDSLCMIMPENLPLAE